MLVILTTVRHPKNANSYERVAQLLNRTLKSACNQLDSNFKVLVVCNKVPIGALQSEKIEYITVSYPPPSARKGAMVDIEDIRKDKSTKVFAGLIYARKFYPDYVMLIDADDLISNKVSEYVNNHLGEVGWYINKGFIYGDGGALIRHTQIFHMKCGSSFIFSWNLLVDLLQIPEDFPEQPAQEEILENIDINFLRNAFAIHRSTKKHFEKLGYPLKSFPFFAAVWMLDTGENHSGKSLLGIGYPISRKIKEEFLLEPPNVSLSMASEYFAQLPSSLIKIFQRVFQSFIPE